MAITMAQAAYAMYGRAEFAKKRRRRKGEDGIVRRAGRAARRGAGLAVGRTWKGRAVRGAALLGALGGTAALGRYTPQGRAVVANVRERFSRNGGKAEPEIRVNMSGHLGSRAEFANPFRRKKKKDGVLRRTGRLARRGAGLTVGRTWLGRGVRAAALTGGLAAAGRFTPQGQAVVSGIRDRFTKKG